KSRRLNRYKAQSTKLKVQRPKTKAQRPSLPLKNINLVNQNSFLVSVERDYDSQPNCCLSSRDHDHEHCENLARHCIHVAGVLQVSGHSNEAKIRGVEN